MNQSNLEKPLKVYNASAGSGKTYQLVLQFLRLLLANKKEHSISEIIAMTFTNKAANEMKYRIIESIFGLSNYPNNIDETTKSYIKTLKKIDGFTETEITETAKKQIKKLLHSYEEFHVMTIDKFNLKLIRQFSRDLDLPGQFEVILEEKEIIEQSIDLLISNVGNEKHKESTELVYDYAKKNIDDGKRWDIRNQMIDFAEILNKETYFPKIEELKHQEINANDFKKWNDKIKKINSEYEQLTTNAFNIYNKLNINDDSLPGKSTVGKQLRKMEHYDSLEQEINKTTINNCSKEPGKGRVFPKELQEAIELAHKYRIVNLRAYEITNLLKNNFHKVALLRFISDEISNIKSADQIIRISEFNKLISKLIQDSSTPYIYERIGTKYNHFLLDEFQDTSRLQWLNMIPLIEESISNGNTNFIVGDPKQAIYRFRNGLAEQFVHLPKIYNPENHSYLNEKSNFFKLNGKKETLKQNRRSSKSIVNFNNNLFKKLAEKLPDNSKGFYDSVQQETYRNETGYVHLISKETEDGDLMKKQVNHIINFIERCEKDGYKRGDICILNNNNSPLNLWGIELIKRNILVVSSDSLFIKNEPKVSLFISYLKRRVNPKNKAEIKHFAYLFFKIKGDQNKYWTYFDEVLQNNKKRKRFNDKRFVNENFIAYKDLFFEYQNIYGLLQKFYKLMDWNELENAYLHHLSDIVFNYQNEKSGDIHSFLTYFEKNSDKMSVQIPETENAIKMMSIHKSKGLQFPIVILPNIDFSIQLFSLNKFLLKIDDEITHTSLKKNTQIEELKKAYNEESNQILTDKINLLYVALTRAQDRIYGINYHKKDRLGIVIHNEIEQDKTHKKNEDSYTWGKEIPRSTIKARRQEDFFVPSLQSDSLWFPDIALSKRKKDSSLIKEQRFGNAFHLLISEVNYPRDLENKLNSFVQLGKIEICFKEELKNKVNSLFNNIEYQNLLKKNTKIISEPNIIIDGINIKRPDKIIFKKNETNIVEFKTGQENEKHQLQLREYANYLRQMNLPKLRGFLYYTNQDYLLEINL